MRILIELNTDHEAAFSPEDSQQDAQALLDYQNEENANGIDPDGFVERDNCDYSIYEAIDALKDNAAWVRAKVLTDD